MSRYYIKFKKEGYIKYTSHLDMLRLFKRSFKRIDIKLQYSQGFNPHPKMSFAQPLSLGYESISEYLEFETIVPYPTDEIVEKLNKVMPIGVEILSCEELPQSGKTLAALTEYAEYRIIIPMSESLDIENSIVNYLSQDKILARKLQKKSGTEIEIDIKPMIRKLSGLVNNNHIMLNTTIDSGSVSNLSPEMVLSTFCQSAKINYERSEVKLTRTEIFFSKANEMKEMD